LPNVWLIVAAFIIKWIAVRSLSKRINALALASPLEWVCDYELQFTKQVIDDVLKLTPEEREHLEAAIRNPIRLKVAH
jgi:hypothetical protein